MQIKYGREKDYADFSLKQSQTANGWAIVQFVEVWSGMMECAAEQSGAEVSETACLTVQAAADTSGISRDEDVLAGAAKLLDCWAYGDQFREGVMYHPPEILSEHTDVALNLWHSSQELLDAVSKLANAYPCILETAPDLLDVHRMVTQSQLEAACPTMTM